MIEQWASASGAISDLRKIGAVEGTHFRVAPLDEDITRYPVAFDIGPMVELMGFRKGDLTFMAEPDFAGFAVVNAAGMELVGCRLIAGAMRSGVLPGEVVYLTVPDE